MTSYTGNGAAQAYAYDANGNRTSLSIGGASYSNTIAADSNRLLGTTGPVPAKTNTYDLAGNLTNDATVTYTYTSRGRMSSATVGTAKTSYLYNGLGQRVRQVTGTAVNPAGLLVYDEAGHIIGEYNSATGKASKEFVYLGDTPVGVLEQVATGTAPNQAHATNVYFYTDHLDTPRVITRSPDGQMVWRWDNGDPFGLLLPNDNPAGLGAFTFNLRMPGQYYDKSTNLLYNYYRDYDPQTGRYIQSDPIGLDGGVNTYGYALGNPVSYTDPKGLFVPALFTVDRVVWTGYRAYRTYQAANAMASAVRAASASKPTGALNGCPPSPGNQDPCKGKREQLAEHEKKYRDYMENPHAHDNKGWLSAAYQSGNMTRYTNILNGRYRELSKQIDNFRRQLEECEVTYGKK